MTTEHDLPPLPEPIGLGLLRYPYDEDDMRSYAKAAVEQKARDLNAVRGALGELMATFRVNMLRYCREPGVDDEIERVLSRFREIGWPSGKGEHHG